MVGILAEDQLQMPFAGDQHPVQALAADAGDPASGYSIRARRLDRVFTIRTPIAVNTASNAAVNFVSRSGSRTSGSNLCWASSRNVVVSEFAITPSRDRAPPR